MQMPDYRSQFLRQIKRRIRRLGIPNSEIAKRSRVEYSTVEMVLSAPITVPLDQIVAVGASVGLVYGGTSQPIRDVYRAAVRTKARYIVRLVQGTSALESQAVDRVACRELTKLAVRELVADRKRIWQ
jgi:hypothetical protein